MAVRAFVMYLALIAIVRSAKKRFLSNATAFDFILTVMVGAGAARAMTGGAPFLPSLLALVVLVAMHWLFSAVFGLQPSHQGQSDADRERRQGRFSGAACRSYVNGRFERRLAGKRRG